MRIVGERFRQRKTTKLNPGRRLALCATLRDTAHVARKLRTGNYSQEARWRLAQAVIDARKADGHRYRPTFYKAAGIGKRSLEAAESLEPNAPSVGEAVLHAIGKAISNWTEGTPQEILEGGPIPDLPAVEPEVDWPNSDVPRAVLLDAGALSDLHEILTAPRERIMKIASLVEAASGPAAAEKFLADAFAARQKHAAKGRDIEPSADVDRDPK